MFSVIMAGGSGTRFWPLSRKKTPKQFLNITGTRPMVVETCNRLRDISEDREIVLIVGKDHLHQTRALFQDRPVHILAEPIGRNTAPCIALGALYAKYQGYEGPIAFLPADHYIADHKAFITALKKAAETAEKGAIVTLGIVPHRPETGYGYIRAAEPPSGDKSAGIYRVGEFVEKPNLEKAMEYLSSRQYYWNAGIFVATSATILEETKNCLPALYREIIKLEPVIGTDDFNDMLNDVYSNIDGISFDYGVMEKTNSDVYVIPVNCGWSDVGSWFSLYELKRDDYDDNENLKEGNVLAMDCKKSYIAAHGNRLVACLGLSNCLVVDTDDALLVADLERSQDIRKIVDYLDSIGSPLT